LEEGVGLWEHVVGAEEVGHGAVGVESVAEGVLGREPVEEREERVGGQRAGVEVDEVDNVSGCERREELSERGV
jgi:hypothetical protein